MLRTTGQRLLLALTIALLVFSASTPPPIGSTSAPENRASPPSDWSIAASLPSSAFTEQNAEFGVTKSVTGDFEISTGDGMSIVLSDAGVLTSLSIDGVTISFTSVNPFAVIDANMGSTGSMGGTVQQSGTTVQQTGTLLQFAMNVTYVAHGGYIEVLIEADNQGFAERAADLSFRLSVARTNAWWWNGPNRKVAVAPSGDYQYAETDPAKVVFGRQKMSFMPYSVVAVGDKAVCMAVQLDMPALFLTGYSAPRQQFYCNYSVGFSEAPVVNPGFARVGLILYRVDAKWGIRSAADRFYQFFPRWFTSSRCVGGVEAIDWPLAVPESGKLRYKHANLNGLRDLCTGNLYGLSTPYEGFRNPAYGVASLPYFNPTGIRLACTDAQNQSRDYIAVLNEYAASTAEINRTAATFIRNTLIMNKANDVQVSFSGGTGNCRVDFVCSPFLIAHALSGPPNDTPNTLGLASTAFTIMDSWDIQVRDLLDFYSKWYVMPSYEDYAPYGTGPEGIFFDNVGAGWEDFNLTHRTYSLLPLSYVDNGTLCVPVPMVASAEVEVLWALRAGIPADYYRNMVIYGNLGVPWPYGMFETIYLDGGLQEQQLGAWGYGGPLFWHTEVGLLSRFAMYQKPISGMDYAISSRELTNQSILRYLAYGMYPLMTGSFTRDDDLYQKYSPIADSLHTAGWGPLTFASVSNPGNKYVTIERFGHWFADSLHFTVRNWNYSLADDVTVTIETDSLAITTAGMLIRELVGDTPIPNTVTTNRVMFTIDIGANETKVFRVYKPTYAVSKLLYDVPNPLLPTQVDLVAYVSTKAPSGADLPTVRFTDNGIALADVPCVRFNATWLYAKTTRDVGYGSHTFGATISSGAVEPTPCLAPALPLELSVTLPLSWPYWLDIEIDKHGIPRSTTFARVPVDFLRVRTLLGIPTPIDAASFRLLDASDSPVVCQWLPDSNTSESGLLVFPMGQPVAGTVSNVTFRLYFDIPRPMPKPSPIILKPPFRRIGPFGVQLLDGTMVLISPLGANVYTVHRTPNLISNGYRFDTAQQGDWEGSLGAYERFTIRILNVGPNVIRLRCLHGAKGNYTSYGVVVNVYANGVVELWATTEYAAEVADQFVLYRRYGWTPPERRGCYMGPDGQMVFVENDQGIESITDFTEPWFGQRDDDGRYSFTVALSPVLSSGMINTWYSEDAVRFRGRLFHEGQSVTYHLVHVCGNGTLEAGGAHARDWLNMTYYVTPEAAQGKPDSMLLLLIAGVTIAIVAIVVTGAYVYRKRMRPAPVPRRRERSIR